MSSPLLAVGTIRRTDPGDSICLSPCQCNTVLMNAEGDNMDLIPDDRRLPLWQHSAWVMRYEVNSESEWRAQCYFKSWMSFKHLDLEVSTILPLEWSLPQCDGFSSSYAASADRIILHTCFQGWLSSFSPSVTRWSDPVYMQTYSLTPPFTATQPVLLTPYCKLIHQSDGAKQELVIFMSPTRLHHP